MERLAVDVGAGLIEGALDAIEERLATTESSEVARSASSDGAPSQSAPQAAPPVEVFGRRDTIVEPTEPPRKRQRSGGLGMGGYLESLPSPAGFGLGPRLDVGVGVGPLVGLVSESMRFGVGGPFSMLMFDVGLGAGWGAPYTPDQTVGVLVMGGMEWVSAYQSGGGPTGSQTASSGFVSVGLRTATQVQAAAVWFGLDGRYRFEPPLLGAPFDVALPRIGFALSAGVMLLADGERGKPAGSGGGELAVAP
jgi:hypothetical protein